MSGRYRTTRRSSFTIEDYLNTCFTTHLFSLVIPHLSPSFLIQVALITSLFSGQRSLFQMYNSSVCAQWLCHVWLFGTPWIVALQAPLFMEFPRQEYWNALPFPILGIFLTHGLNPCLLHFSQILYCWATTLSKNKQEQIRRYFLEANTDKASQKFTDQ